MTLLLLDVFLATQLLSNRESRVEDEVGCPLDVWAARKYAFVEQDAARVGSRRAMSPQQYASLAKSVARVAQADVPVEEAISIAMRVHGAT